MAEALSATLVEANQRNKGAVWRFWKTLEETASTGTGALFASVMAPSVLWHGPSPLGELRGAAQIANDFWLPLRGSFPDLKRQTHIFYGGQSNGRVDGDIAKDGHQWVGGTGYFNGTFAKDYLSIPATGDRVSIRWGEFYRMGEGEEEGRIVEIFLLLDLIDLMQQAGYEVLPPARGKDHCYPPPAAEDGVMLDAADPAQSAYSLEHIRGFIFDGLNAFDESALSSMGMADYFHPDVHWYGPGGIGACLSFKAFEDNHQAHWLHAYPDRKVQNLDALIAEGAFSGGPGWAGVIATHTGQYLDCPATGKTVRFNGMDWWKREGEQYVENWVFVDMIHLYEQFGVDLFARLARQVSARASA
ncbi:MAG: ester cyclase [Pseudomonadota bacterium]